MQTCWTPVVGLRCTWPCARITLSAPNSCYKCVVCVVPVPTSVSPSTVSRDELSTWHIPQSCATCRPSCSLSLHRIGYFYVVSVCWFCLACFAIEIQRQVSNRFETIRCHPPLPLTCVRCMMRGHITNTLKNHV